MNSNTNGNFKSRRDFLTILIEKLDSRKIYLQRISRSYSNYRLLFFLIEVIVFFVLFFSASNLAALISLFIFISVFSVIAHFHNKLERGIKKLGIWTSIKSTHLARLNLDWQNIPAADYPQGDKPPQKTDPNEVDLDLTGNESLLQLINTGTSLQSREMLRAWLNEKELSINTIAERQKIIKELIPQAAFRDKLILHSILASRHEFNGGLLLKFLNKKEALPEHFKLTFALLVVLAPLNVFLFLLYTWHILPAYWLITVLIYFSLYHYGYKDKEKLLGEAEYISDELNKIAGVFQFLERYRYKAGSKLSGMCKLFKIAGRQPSVLINKIKDTAGMLRMKEANPYVWSMLLVIFPMEFYFKLKLNKYKLLVSGKLDTWLEAWYRLEALCSLANFGYLNPGYSFPEIIEDNNKIIFRGIKLGHPLIKNENKVCNDFSFNPEGEIALITGSNMSGKSTFIRTLGINLSLAYAGSVVNAYKLEVSLFDLFTCIRINDSLTDGISFFYAEVKRLKTLLDKIEKSKHPVFFLIDEIFRGTNNIERLKGSSMLIKKLAETNAAGAIATHDLELIKLADFISKIKNYHFKEDIKEGKMIFDYSLNEGPCPTTNALKIMKLEGLPVEE